MKRVRQLQTKNQVRACFSTLNLGNPFLINFNTLCQFVLCKMATLLQFPDILSKLNI